DILRRRAELHGHGGLGDHVAGIRAENVHPEHPIGLGVGEDFHKALGGDVDLGAAVGREWKLSDLVGDACLLELLLTFAHRGELRVRVDHVGNDIVVHVAGLPGEDLRHRNAFVLGLVRQHRPSDHVADRIDAGHVALVMRIDDDAAAVVGLHAHVAEAEAFGVGHAADRHEHHVGFDRLGGAATARSRFDFRLERPTRIVDRRHLGGELKGHALLLQNALEALGHVEIDARQDAVQKFHHGHLGAEPAPTTSSRCGTLSRAMAASDETIRCSSMSMPFSRAMSDPVAITIFLVVSVLSVPLPFTSILPGATMRPVPCTASTLFFLSRNSTPLTLPSTPESLNFIMAFRSSCGGVTMIPMVPKLCPASSNSSEGWSSALEGMRPTLRQVPPYVARFSTTAVFKPSWAARMAQTEPPGPVPMTTRS